MAGLGYRLSDRAILDLQEIAGYIAERSESAADLVLEALYDTFGAVARDEGIGTSLDHHRPGLRMSIGTRPAHNYVIFYRRTGQRVMITRVLHAARDWIALIGVDD